MNDTEDQFEDFDFDTPLTEEEKKLEESQKLKEKNRALFCKFCGEPKHDHWVYEYDDTGKIKKDQFGSASIFKRLCNEELENNLAYYYDDILKNHVEPRPKKTPLTDLFSVDQIKRRGFIAHSMVVGSIRSNFPPHLKAFIKYITQDRHVKKFRYKFLDFTDLRELKFGKDHDFSYGTMDDIPLLVFDLEKEAHDNRADENNLLELIVHREARNKALWFVSPTTTITNKHLTDQEICKRIYAYKQVDLRSKKDREEPPKGGGTVTTPGSTAKADAHYVPPQQPPKKRGSSIPASLGA